MGGLLLLLSGARGNVEDVVEDGLALVLRHGSVGWHAPRSVAGDFFNLRAGFPLADIKKGRETGGHVALAIDPVTGAAVDQIVTFAASESGSVCASGFNHLHDPWHLVDVHVVDAVGVGRPASPFHSSIVARKHDGLLQAGSGKRTEIGGGADAVQGQLVGGWRDIGCVSLGVTLAHEGCGPGGEGLGRPGFFPDEVGLGNRAFFDGPEGLPGDTVECEEESMFRALRHGIDLFASVGDSQQDRWAGKVLVEQVVMDDLEVPDPFAGGGIESEQAVGKEIHPVTLSPVEVGLGSLGSDVDNAPFFIERLAAPGHGPGSSFPGIPGPGIVTELPGARDEVEDPPALSGSDIVGADRSYTADSSHDNEILVDDSRGIET